MNLQRLSSLATTLLCAFTFLFATASAPAAPKKEKVVGTLKTEHGTTILVNGKTLGNDAELRCGDLLETGSESVKVTLVAGKEYVIDPKTRVRLTCVANGEVRFLVIFGGIHPVDGSDDSNEPFPIAGSLSGNIAGTSNGGGGAGADGPTTTRVLPGGQIGLFDSLNRFIRFL